MAQNTTADERTSTERFETEIDTELLIEGDRIHKDLVARSFGQLGHPIRSSPPEADEPAPDTQLVAITTINRYDDVHSVLLADPETGTIVRASRHARNQAMTQKEADWTVRDVGTKVVVEDVKEAQIAENDDPVDDEMEWAQGWVDVLIGDLAAGHDDYSDERKLNGTTLTLEDIECRKLHATISLEE